MPNPQHRPDIPSAARGRWPEILTGLGIDAAHLTNKHGPCPGCGGRDRFRFDDRDSRGTWICGGGGDPAAGDGFDLVAHVLGLDKRESFLLVARYLGLDTQGDPPPRPSAPPPADPQPTRSLADYARELWARVDQSDSAVASHPYARSKGIEWAAGAGRGGASGRKIGRDADCIIVPVRSPDGELCAVECLSDHTDEHGKFVRQAFGPKRDGWLTLGNDRDAMIPRYVVEGWATGARLFGLKRNCLVAVAFGSGRMQEVAEQIERRAPGSIVTICTEAPHAR
jgi:putative DNA primase/helicase